MCKFRFSLFLTLCISLFTTLDLALSLYSRKVFSRAHLSLPRRGRKSVLSIVATWKRNRSFSRTSDLARDLLHPRFTHIRSVLAIRSNWLWDQVPRSGMWLHRKSQEISSLGRTGCVTPSHRDVRSTWVATTRFHLLRWNASKCTAPFI